MARLTGSNKYWQQAKKTVAHLYDVEVLIDGAVLDAIQTIIDLSSNPKIAAASRMSAAKLIVDTHQKIAKAHGPQPKPAAYTTLSTTYKESNREAEEDDGKVIEMQFKG